LARGYTLEKVLEILAYEKENQHCIIFMEKIDAIGERRFSEGSSADREIQRNMGIP